MNIKKAVTLELVKNKIVDITFSPQDAYVSGITFIWYAQCGKIGNPDNMKVFESNKKGLIRIVKIS